VNRGRYLGSGLSLVDDKGRLAIPASLRGTLLANTPGIEGKGGGTIFVGVHQSSKCLVAFDPGYVDRLSEDLDRRERENTAEGGEFDYNIKRCGGLGGEATPFDSSGRFVLPGFPRFHAGIGSHAFFWGTLDYIEIWDPKTLFDAAGLPDVMTSACRYHLMDKKVVL
jgi:MraZ protein